MINNNETELLININNDYCKIPYNSILDIINNKYNNINFNESNIIYKKLEIVHINQLVQLHNLLFPINYSREYFKTIIHNKENIKIGAFIIIDDYEYLIGFILIKIYNDYYFSRYIDNSEIRTELFNRNSFFKLISPYKIAYLATIGVIKEYQRKGIPSKLLMKVEEILNSDEDIIGIMLHVLDSNESAIKFYNKNKFIKANKIVKDHYLFDDAYHDAFVYYKLYNNLIKAEENKRIFEAHPVKNIIKSMYYYILSYFK